MIKYLILFIIFGIFGWLVDSAYRLTQTKKWKPQTQIPFFSPIYAIGGLISIAVYENAKVHWIIQIIFVTFLLVLLELCSGIFSEKIMKKKYWDYSNSKINYKGYIDAKHAFYWLLLATLVKVFFLLSLL